MNAWRRAFLGLLAAVTLGLISLAFPQLYSGELWRQQVSPGPLTPAHAFLEQQCSACHVTLESVPPEQCIVCHANETSLLQRQATAFHASIGACADCHTEHRVTAGGTAMDHQTLAAIGLRKLKEAKPGSDQKRLDEQLTFWLNASTVKTAGGNPHLASEEVLLDCKTCHASRDRHWDLFGTDCAQCHATTQWTLAEFRHPPPSSTDCVQCHRPPPSHMMGHYNMVSEKLAGMKNVPLEQCYICHQTTAWNDIRKSGVIKHH